MTRPKILIVEDDADTRKGLEIRLRAHGYETALATDAITAVRTTLRETPDLLLLDLGLPGGDGLAVMEHLAGLAPVARIPVLILTGRDIHTSRERAEELGARGILQKPADNSLLMRTIARILEDHGCEASPTAH